MGSENVYEYDEFDLQTGSEDLKNRREYFSSLKNMSKPFSSDVTIWIQAYNNFEKTKRCIESVLEYTKDVDFDLVLVDNNAGDETYNYFKQVEYEKKTIIHFNKNTGSAFPFLMVPLDMISKYFVLLNNDLIVTKNWLVNLLKVMESDSSIGIVNPMSSNASNYQGIDIKYSNYEQMQEIASRINISNPDKWEQRLRVVTLGTLIRKECLCAMGWPLFDIGFSHNFMDDDMSIRARRAGYKVYVAGDTWICHDHAFDRNADAEVIASYERDIKKYEEKYYGIDPWGDVADSLIKVPNLIESIEKSNKQRVEILGIDVKCGMNILDLKNICTHRTEIITHAYFQDAKYYADLKSVCNGEVISDNENNLECHFENKKFDYIVIGEPINIYSDPIRMIKSAYRLLAEKGQLIVSLKNTKSIVAMLNMMGYKIGEMGIYQDISFDTLNTILNGNGIQIRSVAIEKYDNISEDALRLVENMINNYANKNVDISEIKARIYADRYWLVIKK